MDNILFFKDIVEECKTFVGSKAYAVADLYKRGFNVPNGFIINRDVFLDYCGSNDVVEKIRDMTIDYTNPIDIEAKSILIQKQFSFDLSEIVKNKISSMLSQLCEDDDTIKKVFDMIGIDKHKFVVLRLSRSDSLNSPIFFNIRGEKELFDAIRQAYLVYFDAESMLHRYKLGLTDLYDLSLVVQLMIPFKSSGIAYSVNPTGLKDEIVIESVFGYGKTMITDFQPDIFVVKKDGFNIISQTLGKKEYALGREGGKTVKKNIAENQKSVSSVSNSDINEISKLVEKIETLYGVPMEIDWGIQNGNIYLLNAKESKSESQDQENMVEVEEVNDDMISTMYDNYQKDQDFGPELSDESSPVMDPSVTFDQPSTESDSTDRQQIDYIIDKYITINPDLKQVLLLLKEEINNYFNK